MIHLSPFFNFISAEYAIHKYQITYQCQLSQEGILTKVFDKQIPQRLLRNTFIHLHSQLSPGSAFLYALNLHVKITDFYLNTPPELAILSPNKADSDNQSDSWLNPVVIIETVPFDKRDNKFRLYQNLISLREYIRIDTEHYWIEHFVRQPGKEWKESQIETWQDKVHLESFDGHLLLAAVYDKVGL